jgi:hypothetical protein
MRTSFLKYEKMCKYLVIFGEPASHKWLCTRFLLNFQIYEVKNILLFFNSVMYDGKVQTTFFVLPPQFSLPDSGAEEAKETVEVEAVEAREARAVAEKKARDRSARQWCGSGSESGSGSYLLRHSRFGSGSESNP